MPKIPPRSKNIHPYSLVLDMLQDTRSGNSGIHLHTIIVKILLIFVKVLQRIYKYGGQPFVRDYLALHYGKNFDNTFGKGTGKAIMHATAGR